MKLIVFIIYVISITSTYSQASRCHSIQKSILIDPCNQGGSAQDNSGSQDDWSGGREYEVFPVEGERIDPAGYHQIGGGPNLGHIGNMGRPPEDRGEPGPGNSLNEDHGPTQEDNTARNCSHREAVIHNGETVGFNFSGCVSPSLDQDSEVFAIENFSNATEQIATELTLDTIEAMAPSSYQFSWKLKFKIDLNLKEISEDAISDFINQTMTQIAINLKEAGVEVGKLSLDRFRGHLFNEVNFRVNEVGRGPSLNITQINAGHFGQEGSTSFAAPSGEFRNQIQNLDQRLKNTHPTEEQKIQAKSLAETTLQTADEEFFKGNSEVAETSLSIATELADFAASLTPGLSIAKDAFELFTGKNAITGNSLTDSDRVFAGLGLMTLGGANWFKFAPRLAKKLLRGSRSTLIGSFLSEVGDELVNTLGHGSHLGSFVNSAKELGLKPKLKYQNYLILPNIYQKMENQA